MCLGNWTVLCLLAIHVSPFCIGPGYSFFLVELTSLGERQRLVKLSLNTKHTWLFFRNNLCPFINQTSGIPHHGFMLTCETFFHLQQITDFCAYHQANQMLRDIYSTDALQKPKHGTLACPCVVPADRLRFNFPLII